MKCEMCGGSGNGPAVIETDYGLGSAACPACHGSGRKEEKVSDEEKFGCVSGPPVIVWPQGDAFKPVMAVAVEPRQIHPTGSAHLTLDQGEDKDATISRLTRERDEARAENTVLHQKMERMNAHGQARDKRIRAQRAANRDTWEIVEMRRKWLGSETARNGYCRLIVRHRETLAALTASRAECERLREALENLNSAIDGFWNDESRPSLARMRGNSIAAVENAQSEARAALSGSTGGDGEGK